MNSGSRLASSGHNHKTSIPPRLSACGPFRVVHFDLLRSTGKITIVLNLFVSIASIALIFTSENLSRSVRICRDVCRHVLIDAGLRCIVSEPSHVMSLLIDFRLIFNRNKPDVVHETHRRQILLTDQRSIPSESRT